MALFMALPGLSLHLILADPDRLPPPIPIQMLSYHCQSQFQFDKKCAKYTVVQRTCCQVNGTSGDVTIY